MTSLYRIIHELSGDTRDTFLHLRDAVSYCIRHGLDHPSHHILHETFGEPIHHAEIAIPRFDRAAASKTEPAEDAMKRHGEGFDDTQRFSVPQRPGDAWYMDGWRDGLGLQEGVA